MIRAPCFFRVMATVLSETPCFKFRMTSQHDDRRKGLPWESGCLDSVHGRKETRPWTGGSPQPSLQPVQPLCCGSFRAHLDQGPKPPPSFLLSKQLLPKPLSPHAPGRMGRRGWKDGGLTCKCNPSPHTGVPSLWLLPSLGMTCWQ